MGLGVLWTVTRTRSAWPVWLLIAVVPFYTSTRIAGLWSGREVLDVAKVFGEDRAQSLEFRMQNEDILIDHALKNAIFGGGRTDGAQVYDDERQGGDDLRRLLDHHLRPIRAGRAVVAGRDDAPAGRRC